MLHGANISKLSFCFLSGGIGQPPATNKIVSLGLKVEAQLVIDIGCRIGTEQTGIASPQGAPLHAGFSGDVSRGAFSTLATAVT